MLEALLKFFFFIIVIYYAFKLFIRYALPWIIARFMKKQQEKFNMGGFQNGNHQQEDEGSVKVKSNKTNKPKDDSEFGEYVDFEDVVE